MNKARAYKELQRRQTKRLSELLMTLYAAERAAGRLQLDMTDCAVAAAAPAVLLVLGGSSGGDRGCSRLSGVSNGAAAAAVISYVATQLPRIGGGSGGGQPSQPPPPPPWALAPAPSGLRPSTAAAPGRNMTAGLCGAAAVAAPAAEAAVGRGLELQRGTRSAGRGRLRRFAGDGGGSASNSARTPTSGGSSSGSSDPGAAAGEELSSSPDRQAAAAATAAPTTATAPIFPTASQMRQLLSSLAAADSRFGSGDFGGRARHPPRSAVHHRLGRCPADDGNVGHTLGLLPQPSTAAGDCTAHPSNSCLASHPVVVESLTTATRLTATSASPGRNSSRRNGGGGVAKQVSFVDPQPTQVQLVSPPSSPPGSPPPQPPWWWANAEAAAAARRATSAAAAIAASSALPVPVLSEKNLQLHAAAMHAAAVADATGTPAAVAATSAARRKKEPAAGGNEQPPCSLDERTAAWIRERQVPKHATSKPVAFSGIPEESDSERVDLAS